MSAAFLVAFALVGQAVAPPIEPRVVDVEPHVQDVDPVVDDGAVPEPASEASPLGIILVTSEVALGLAGLVGAPFVAALVMPDAGRRC